MTKNCTSCGTTVRVADAFCGKCGAATPGGTPVERISDRPESSVISLPPSRAKSLPSTGGAATALAQRAFPVSHTGKQSVVRTRSDAAEADATVLPLKTRRTDPSLEAPAQEPASDDAPQSVELKPAIAGPPVLASDLLRERNEPSEPGQVTHRRLVWGLSLAGLGVSLVLAGNHALGWASAALLVSAMTLAVTPLSYAGRAAGLFVIGVIGAAMGVWQQTLAGLEHDIVLLAGATILTAGSLIFRAYYRAARFARLTVACGIVALGTWFVLTGGLGSLVMLELAWQSWAPALTLVAIGLLAILSMLSFMEGNTRAAAHVWGYTLLGMYALHIGARVAANNWSVDSNSYGLAGPETAAILVGMVCVAIASGALAQLWVALYRKLH